jgi:hypothetical protein
MEFEPALPDRIVQTRGVFCRRALVAEQERPIERFDVDTPVLHDLECVRVLHQAMGGLLRINVGSIGGVFHRNCTFSPRSWDWYFRAIQSR